MICEIRNEGSSQNEKDKLYYYYGFNEFTNLFVGGYE